MSALLARMKKEARKNLQGQVLEKGTGKLFKSLTYNVRNNFCGWIRASAPYASLHEMGATVKPKLGKVLWLKIQGKTLPVESVTIPARPFLKPVVDEYSKSQWVETIMDPILQKALDEIFKPDTGVPAHD